MTGHLLIWGNTPLAAYLAASLHPHHTLTWLADDLTQQAVTAANGVTYGSRKVTDLAIVTDLREAKKPDLIIFAMPAWGTAAALQALSRIQNPPPILSLQFGVGNVERITSQLGEKAVLGGVVTQPIHFLTRPDGTNTPLRASLRLESWGGIALQHDHPLSMEAANLLRKTGLKVELGDREAILWSSVFWGIQGNALSTILNVSPADIYNDPELFAYEYEQLLEALVIFKRAGITLTRLPDVDVPRLAKAIHWLNKPLLRRWLSRQPRPPSLKQDLLAGTHRSEAAYINGAIAIQADKMKLQTPLNYTLALTVTDIAEGRAKWSHYNKKTLAATLRLAKG